MILKSQSLINGKLIKYLKQLSIISIKFSVNVVVIEHFLKGNSVKVLNVILINLGRLKDLDIIQLMIYKQKWVISNLHFYHTENKKFPM